MIEQKRGISLGKPPVHVLVHVHVLCFILLRLILVIVS